MKQIVDLVRNRMTTVLLPVFCDLETGLRIVREIKPHVMHLCSTDMLSLDDLRSVKKELGEIKLLQAIPVGLPGRSDKTDSLGLALEYQEVADIFILDTYAGDYSEGSTEVPGMIGITGKVHDWAVSRKIVEQCRKPVILAGGLNPDNVAAAIKLCSPGALTRAPALTSAAGKKILPKSPRLSKMHARLYKKINKHIINYPYFRLLAILCRIISNSTTAPATDALSESSSPFMGIEMQKSHLLVTSCRMPLPSAPIMTATSRLKSNPYKLVSASGAVPTIQTPSFFNSSTVAAIFTTRHSGICSIAPDEAFATAPVIEAERSLGNMMPVAPQQ